MVRLDVLLACRDQFDQRWELPIPLAKSVQQALIGWSVSPAPVDAGLPEPVAHVLSNAVLKHFLVTFPTRQGRQISFVHSRDSGSIRSAFEDDYFDWTQKHQCLFLSPIEAPPPQISQSDLMLVRRGESMDEISRVGVKGLVLPGVDGDVAGIYTFSPDLQARLLGDIGDACNEAGSHLQFVSEIELIDALAQH